MENMEVGGRTTPSVVNIDDLGQKRVGFIAKARAPKFPKQTLYDAKRFFGRTINDQEIIELSRYWPFDIVGDHKGNPVFLWHGDRI